MVSKNKNVTSKSEKTEKSSDSELFLRTILDTNPNMIFVKDAKELRFVHLNKTGEKLIGLTEEEVIGKNDYDFFPKHQADFFTSKDREVLNSDKVLPIEEEELQTADGLRILRTKKVAIRNSEGDPLYLLGVSEDITNQKEFQAQVIEKNKELKEINDTINQSSLVSVLDLNGDIIKVNELFCNISGYSEEELIGKHYGSLSSDFKESLWKEISSSIDSGDIFRRELQCCDKNGNCFWVDAIINPIFSEENQVTHYRTIMQDITLRKEIEEEIKKAKNDAEKSNRLKTLFLGSLSHEVRTPLQAIMGFVEILENDNLPSDQRASYLNIVMRRAKDLMLIIDSLLDIASIESGEIEANPQRFSYSSVVDELHSRFLESNDLHGKDLTITNHNELPSDLELNMDPVHLKQVLTNLMRNAMKFTNEGSITIKSEVLDEGIKVSVIDTGIGINQEKINTIFQPFRQAHEGHSRSQGGIGLGLSICKKMIKLWGGELKVESEERKGSTFSFNIPASHITTKV